MSEYCYICHPDDPNANEEGCEACDREYWTHVVTRGTPLSVALEDAEIYLRERDPNHEGSMGVALILGALVEAVRRNGGAP